MTSLLSLLSLAALAWASPTGGDVELPSRPEANIYTSLDQTNVYNSKLNFNNNATTATNQFMWQYYEVNTPDAVHAMYEVNVTWNTKQWLKDGKQEGTGVMMVYVTEEGFPMPTNWDYRAYTTYSEGQAQMNILVMNAKPNKAYHIAVGGSHGCNYTIAAKNMYSIYNTPTNIYLEDKVNLDAPDLGMYPGQYKSFQVELPERCSHGLNEHGDYERVEDTRCMVEVQFDGEFQRYDGFKAFINPGKTIPTRASHLYHWSPLALLREEELNPEQKPDWLLWKDIEHYTAEFGLKHDVMDVEWTGIKLTEKQLLGARYLTITVTADVAMFTEGRKLPFMRVVEIDAEDMVPQRLQYLPMLARLRKASMPKMCKEHCATIEHHEVGQALEDEYQVKLFSEECQACLRYEREYSRHMAFQDFPKYESCWQGCDEECNAWCEADCDANNVQCLEGCQARCTRFSHGCTSGCMLANNNQLWTECFTECDNTCYNTCEANHAGQEEQYESVHMTYDYRWYNEEIDGEWDHETYGPYEETFYDEVAYEDWDPEEDPPYYIPIGWKGIARSPYEVCIEECDEVCGPTCILDEMAVLTFNDPALEYCFEDCRGDIRPEECQKEMDKPGEYNYDAYDPACDYWIANDFTIDWCVNNGAFNPHCLNECDSSEAAFWACYGGQEYNKDGYEEENLYVTDDIVSYCVRMYGQSEQCEELCEQLDHNENDPHTKEYYEVLEECLSGCDYDSYEAQKECTAACGDELSEEQQQQLMKELEKEGWTIEDEDTFMEQYISSVGNQYFMCVTYPANVAAYGDDYQYNVQEQGLGVYIKYPTQGDPLSKKIAGQMYCSAKCVGAMENGPEYEDLNFLLEYCNHCENPEEDQNPFTCLMDCLWPTWKGPAPDGGELYHCAKDCDSLPFNEQKYCIDECYAAEELGTCVADCGHGHQSKKEFEKEYQFMRDDLTGRDYDDEEWKCSEECIDAYCSENCQAQWLAYRQSSPYFYEHSQYHWNVEMEDSSSDEDDKQAEQDQDSSYEHTEYVGWGFDSFAQCEKSCKQVQMVKYNYEQEIEEYEHEEQHWKHQMEEKQEEEQQEQARQEVKDQIQQLEDAAWDRYKNNNGGKPKQQLKLSKSMFSQAQFN